MPQQLSPFLEGKYGWDYGEAGWDTGMNENLLKFSFMFDRNVDSITASLPSAVNGQAHYLTTDNRIYFAVGSTYYSTPVPKNFIVFVKSTGDAYQFNGTSLTQVDSHSQIDSRLDTIEVTVSSLGTAAFEDVSAFATSAELDVVEGQAQAYTDVLRLDLADTTDPAKGAGLVGFVRSEMNSAINSVGHALSAQSVNIWEYAGSIVEKPDPVNPSTWDWTPAFQEAVNATGVDVLCLKGNVTYNLGTVTGDKSICISGPKTAVLRKLPNTTGNMFTFGADTDISISGVTFDGAFTAQAPETTGSLIDHRVNGTAVERIRLNIYNCTFINQQYTSIRFQILTDSPGLTGVFRVHNCEFIGGREGLEGFEPRYISLGGAVLGSVLYSTFSLGAAPTAAGIAGVTLSNNNVTPQDGSVLVCGCTFKNVGRSASNRLGCIEMYNGGANLIIAHNRGYNAHGRFISVKNNAKNIVIIGNTLDGMASPFVGESPGITVTGVGGTTARGRIAVSNNIINGARGKGITISGESGEGVYRDLVLANNIVSDSSNENIAIYNTFGASLSNNRSINNGAGNSILLSNCSGVFSVGGTVVEGGVGVGLIATSQPNLELVVNGGSYSGMLRGLQAEGVKSLRVVGAKLTGNSETGLRVSGLTSASMVTACDLTGNGSADYTTPGGAPGPLSILNNTRSSTVPASIAMTSSTISVFDQFHRVDTEGGAASGDLTTINGGVLGRSLSLRATSAGRVVTILSSGNIRLVSNAVLDSLTKTVTLVFDGANWMESGRNF